MAIPMGLAGLGNAGMHRNQDFGNALRYPDDLNPGGWDPKERLGVMDAEGIDIAVLYCGLGQSLGGFTDVDLAVACTRFGTTGSRTGPRPIPSGSSAPQ